MPKTRPAPAAADPLTGLPSRQAFFARLADHMGTPFAVLSLDVDGLHDINQQHGHTESSKVHQFSRPEINELPVAMTENNRWRRPGDRACNWPQQP